MKKLAVLLLLAVTGCAVKPIYLNREGQSVAVLPPFNATNYIEASDKVWPHVEHEMASRGYAVVPRETILAFYKSKGFSVADEIAQYKNEELAHEFKCDFILWSNVEKWDRVTTGLYTELGVGVAAVLREGKDGTEIWKGKGEAGDSSFSLSPKDMVGNTIGGLLSSVEKYAGPATRKCFEKMPWAGFDPEPKKQ